MSLEISRRQFVAGAAAAALSGKVCLPSPASPTPAPDKFEEFDYDQVQLTGGPLKQQYDRVLANYLALDNDRLLKVYRERAGLPAPGEAMGGWYGADGFVPGHTLGQYISGLARMSRTTGNAECQTKVGALVEGFAATMGAADRVFAGPNAEKVWPCYILDKHLAGLIDAYTLCGIAQAQTLMPRVLHGALPFIPDRGRDRIGKKDPPYDETYVLPENLFTAHHLTGDPAFKARAIAYLLDREYFDPLARREDVLPGRHAYSHAIALSSGGMAYRVLGEEKYLRAMLNAWNFLAATQQYASGGWGPNETFIEPHKGQLYESLRNTDNHFETPCGSYAAIKLARYLLCATADARYGDGLERVLYNCILAVKEPDSDGDYPYYSTYGPRARKVYYPKRWPCCSGTLVQCVADYVKNIYFRSSDGVAVNLYAPSTLHFNIAGTAVKLTQETAYPLSPLVKLRIESSAPAAFTLRLRVPGWLEQPAMVHVNGKPIAYTSDRGFAILKRRWSSSDIVTLNLPQVPRTEPIDDLHLKTVAVLRGPLLYVELNPRQEFASLGDPEKQEPMQGAPGIFVERTEGRDRVHMPLYFVREESYTTYFEKG